MRVLRGDGFSERWVAQRLSAAVGMERAAQAMAESRIVAVQPPWIVPSGLKKRGEGVPTKTTLPSSASTNSKRRATAAA